MLTCRICGCNCDPGDLVNGVCDDCRQERRKREEEEWKMDRLARLEFKQLELEDVF